MRRLVSAGLRCFLLGLLAGVMTVITGERWLMPVMDFFFVGGMSCFIVNLGFVLRRDIEARAARLNREARERELQLELDQARQQLRVLWPLASPRAMKLMPPEAIERFQADLAGILSTSRPTVIARRLRECTFDDHYEYADRGVTDEVIDGVRVFSGTLEAVERPSCLNCGKNLLSYYRRER